jgi:hypothetical protein
MQSINQSWINTKYLWKHTQHSFNILVPLNNWDINGNMIFSKYVNIFYTKIYNIKHKNMQKCK